MNNYNIKQGQQEKHRNTLLCRLENTSPHALAQEAGRPHVILSDHQQLSIPRAQELFTIVDHNTTTPLQSSCYCKISVQACLVGWRFNTSIASLTRPCHLQETIAALLCKSGQLLLPTGEPICAMACCFKSFMDRSVLRMFPLRRD